MNRFWLVPLIVLLWMPLHADEPSGADPDQIEAFKEFLNNRHLGQFVDGVWVFAPPPTRSKEDELGSIAYGLESYKLYAKKTGKTVGELGKVLGLETFSYDIIMIPKSDLITYFSVTNSRDQLKLLYRHLDQPDPFDLFATKRIPTAG